MRSSQQQLLHKKDLVGVEIGVWRAGNAVDMLSNLDIKKLYLIDPYAIYTDGIRTFHEDGFKAAKLRQGAIDAIEEFKDKVVWIYKSSMEAEVDEELDFVYIDGDHMYHEVMKDMEKWTAKVKSGGLVSGHDYDILATASAVQDYCRTNGYQDALHSGSSEPGALDWWFIK